MPSPMVRTGPRGAHLRTPEPQERFSQGGGRENRLVEAVRSRLTTALRLTRRRMSTRCEHRGLLFGRHHHVVLCARVESASLRIESDTTQF